MELRQRLEQDGATEYVGPQGSATLKERGASYDPARLETLLEYLEEEELVKAQALVPEHEETRVVPRKWNATKLKPFAKRGRDIRETIETARMVGGYNLSVKGTRAGEQVSKRRDYTNRQGG